MLLSTLLKLSKILESRLVILLNYFTRKKMSFAYKNWTNKYVRTGKDYEKDWK